VCHSTPRPSKAIYFSDRVAAASLAWGGGGGWGGHAVGRIERWASNSDGGLCQRVGVGFLLAELAAIAVIAATGDS